MTSYTFADPPPYAHQVRMLRRIIETRGRCALLADPGTGKTRAVLDYLSALAVKTDAPVRALVVAPLAAVDTWVTQAVDWCGPQVDVWAEALGGSIQKKGEALAARGNDDADGVRRSIAALGRTDGKTHQLTSRSKLPKRGPAVVLCIVNVDTFSSRAAASPGGTVTSADRAVRAVKEFRPDVIVVDESHLIKSRSSNRTRTLLRVRDVAPRRLLLTGTVMPHSPMDVYSQWRWLNPDTFATMRRGELKAWTFSQFQQRFAVMGGWQGKEMVAFQNLDELQDRMANDAVVVRKEDALDLPPTTEVTVPVHLAPKEKRAYREMRDSLATALDDGTLMTAPNPLVKMLRLRQITSGFVVDDQTGGVTEVGKSKLRTIKSLVNDTLAGEKRVVVFAHFRRDVEALAAELTDAVEITGDTSPDERVKLRLAFGPEGDLDSRMVLVCQIRTMSLAVNELVTASHAVFASLSERRDDLIQAQDRLNRIGQTRPVTYHFVTAPGTVDGVMLDAIRNRTSVEKAVLEHVRQETT